MKALISALLVSCALAAPVCAFAQSNAAADTAMTNNGPLTRAEVRADLVRVEQAGYRPWESDINYPNDIQHAEAIVAHEQAQSTAGAVGGVAMTGSSDSGVHIADGPAGQSIYAGH